MRIFKIAIVLMLALAVTACGKFQKYNGPPVTQVVVEKELRKMYLMSGSNMLKSYDIGLGFAPEGHKEIEGDGRTPEGTYFIDRRNPESRFYLSLGVSYPNNEDRAHARSLGKSPGGDIFIHGRPWQYRKGGRDWTWGCIAVTNAEMRQIFAMVRTGTPIVIKP